MRSRLSPAEAGNVLRGWRSASRRRACLPPYDDAHARSFRGGRDVGSGVVRERGDGRNRDASAGGWRTSDARRGGLSVGRFTGRRRTVSAHSEHGRSEEHTSELQSLMRISYAVFCLKTKNTRENRHSISKYTNAT